MVVMSDTEAIVAREIRQSARRARVRYALPPLIALVLVLSIALPFSQVLGLFSYRQVMPVLLFIFGIFVMLIGSFWDFGAKMYVRELVDHHLPFGEEELNYIFKQQFILTSIYIGIGAVYILTAFIIYFI